MACVVHGCINNPTYNPSKQPLRDSAGGKLTFHKFPLQNPEICKRWVDFVQPGWIPDQNSKVCSEHFDEKWFMKNYPVRRLVWNAVPTLISKILLQSDEMQTPFCQVPGCPNKIVREKCKLVRFPQRKRDQREFIRWIENIMNFPEATDPIINNITSESRVCIDHFEPECFKMMNNKQILRYGSVPTLKLLGKPIHRNTFKEDQPPVVKPTNTDTNNVDLDIPKCAVSNCTSTFLSDKVAFHPYPIDWAQNIQWIQTTKKYNCDNKFEYLCSKHFTEDCFESGLTRILKKGSVPSIFEDNSAVSAMEQVMLPDMMRKTDSLFNILNTEDPLAAASAADSNYMKKKPKSPPTPKTSPQNVSVKRQSTDNKQPQKIVPTSSTSATTTPSKIIVIKKQGNSDISLMSPDKKITFVPKNTIKIASSKTDVDKNGKPNIVIKNFGGLVDKVPIKIVTGENFLTVNNNLKNNESPKVGRIIIDKDRKQLENLLSDKGSGETAPIFAKQCVDALENVDKNVKISVLNENIINKNGKMGKVLLGKNQGENDEMEQDDMRRGQKLLKLKPKYYFLQSNDVKLKRKLLATNQKGVPQTNKEPQDINDVNINLRENDTLRDKKEFKIKKSGKVVSNSKIQKNKIHMNVNIPQNVIESIATDKSKGLSMLGYETVNSTKTINIQKNDKKVVKRRKMQKENEIKSKQKNKTSLFVKSVPEINSTSMQTNIFNNLDNLSSENFKSNMIVGAQTKTRQPKINVIPERLLKAPQNLKKENFISCNTNDIIEFDDITPDDSRDPLALSEDSSDENSLLVPMKPKSHSKKTPRKVSIKYVAQNNSVGAIQKNGHSKIRNKKFRIGLDPLLFKKALVNKKFDHKIMSLIPKVILQDIFHGKNRLPNSNVRITVRTRTLPKFLQKKQTNSKVAVPQTVVNIEKQNQGERTPKRLSPLKKCNDSPKRSPVKDSVKTIAKRRRSLKFEVIDALSQNNDSNSSQEIALKPLKVDVEKLSKKAIDLLTQNEDCLSNNVKRRLSRLDEKAGEGLDSSNMVKNVTKSPRRFRSASVGRQVVVTNHCTETEQLSKESIVTVQSNVNKSNVNDTQVSEKRKNGNYSLVGTRKRTVPARYKSDDDFVYIPLHFKSTQKLSDKNNSQGVQNKNSEQLEGTVSQETLQNDQKSQDVQKQTSKKKPKIGPARFKYRDLNKETIEINVKTTEDYDQNLHESSTPTKRKIGQDSVNAMNSGDNDAEDAQKLPETAPNLPKPKKKIGPARFKFRNENKVLDVIDLESDTEEAQKLVVDLPKPKSKKRMGAARFKQSRDVDSKQDEAQTSLQSTKTAEKRKLSQSKKRIGPARFKFAHLRQSDNLEVGDNEENIQSSPESPEKAAPARVKLKHLHGKKIEEDLDTQSFPEDSSVTKRRIIGPARFKFGRVNSKETEDKVKKSPEKIVQERRVFQNNWIIGPARFKLAQLRKEMSSNQNDSVVELAQKLPENGETKNAPPVKNILSPARFKPEQLNKMTVENPKKLMDQTNLPETRITNFNQFKFGDSNKSFDIKPQDIEFKDGSEKLSKDLNHTENGSFDVKRQKSPEFKGQDVKSSLEADKRGEIDAKKLKFEKDDGEPEKKLSESDQFKFKIPDTQIPDDKPFLKSALLSLTPKKFQEEPFNFPFKKSPVKCGQVLKEDFKQTKLELSPQKHPIVWPKLEAPNAESKLTNLLPVPPLVSIDKSSPPTNKVMFLPKLETQNAVEKSNDLMSLPVPPLILLKKKTAPTKLMQKPLKPRLKMKSKLALMGEVPRRRRLRQVSPIDPKQIEDPSGKFVPAIIRSRRAKKNLAALRKKTVNTCGDKTVVISPVINIQTLPTTVACQTNFVLETNGDKNKSIELNELPVKLTAPAVITEKQESAFDLAEFLVRKESTDDELQKTLQIIPESILEDISIKDMSVISAVDTSIPSRDIITIEQIPENITTSGSENLQTLQKSIAENESETLEKNCSEASIGTPIQNTIPVTESGVSETVELPTAGNESTAIELPPVKTVKPCQNLLSKNDSQLVSEVVDDANIENTEPPNVPENLTEKITDVCNEVPEQSLADQSDTTTSRNEEINEYAHLISPSCTVENVSTADENINGVSTVDVDEQNKSASIESNVNNIEPLTINGDAMLNIDNVNKETVTDESKKVELTENNVENGEKISEADMEFNKVGVPEIDPFVAKDLAAITEVETNMEIEAIINEAIDTQLQNVSVDALAEHCGQAVDTTDILNDKIEVEIDAVAKDSDTTISDIVLTDEQNNADLVLKDRDIGDSPVKTIDKSPDLLLANISETVTRSTDTSELNNSVVSVSSNSMQSTLDSSDPSLTIDTSTPDTLVPDLNSTDLNISNRSIVRKTMATQTRRRLCLRRLINRRDQKKIWKRYQKDVLVKSLVLRNKILECKNRILFNRLIDLEKLLKECDTNVQLLRRKRKT